MSMLLENKVIVITGGAGLIGSEFVKTVLENNGTAIIADFDKKRGVITANKLKELVSTGIIDFQWLDINNKESILRVIDILNKKYGRIDALVNNAYPRNKNYGQKFEDVTYDDFTHYYQEKIQKHVFALS